MTYAASGRRKQGKSTLGRFIAGRTRSRVIIDPRGDMHSDFAAIVERTDDIHRAINELQRTDRRFEEVIITPRHMRAAFVATTGALNDWRARDPFARFALLLDEWRLIESRLRPADLEDFEYLIRASDVDRQHVIFTCHRPIDMHPDIRAIMDHWLIFRMTEANDVKAIERLSVRAALRAQRIGPREYVHLDSRENESDSNPHTFTAHDRWFVCLRCGYKPCRCQAAETPIELEESLTES